LGKGIQGRKDPTGGGSRSHRNGVAKPTNESFLSATPPSLDPATRAASGYETSPAGSRVPQGGLRGGSSGLSSLDPPSALLPSCSASRRGFGVASPRFAPLALPSQCVTRVKGGCGSDALPARAGAGRPLTPRGIGDAKRVTLQKGGEVSCHDSELSRPTRSRP